MKPYRKWTAAKILDVGEYSMVVNTILPDIKVFRVNGKLNTEHWAKEIIASEKGCVAYFDERINKDFEKGEIYSLYISNENDTYWKLEAMASMTGIMIIDPTRTFTITPNV